MKTSLHLVLFVGMLFATSITSAQFQTIPIAIPSDATIGKLSIVNQNVVWGSGRKANWKTYTGFIRTTNGGTTWIVDTLQNAGVTCLFDICAIDSNTAYVIGYGTSITGRGIFKTVDGGKNWIKATNAFNQSRSFPNAIHFFNPKEGIAIGDPVSGYYEIYTTVDSGETWTRVPSTQIPTPLTEESGYVGYAPSVCHTDNAFWFMTTKSRLLRTLDKGLTWNAITVAPPPSAGHFVGYYPAFKDENNGIVGDGYVIMRTTNGGVSWEFLNVPNRPGTDEVYNIPGTTGGYFAVSPYSGATGSMYTLNNGNTWAVIDTISRTSMLFLSASSSWGCSPTKNVIYKYIGQPLAVRDQRSEIPSQYLLMQNYPNPFNPGTMIKYSLPNDAHVTLKIYDVLGREVVTLVNEQQAPGNYEVKLDGCNLSSGIYFYRLQTNRYSAVKKLTLIK